MPINASYEYTNAEKLYDQAKTMEEKISALEEMIRRAPAHKGGENLRKELRNRLKRFLEKKEKSKKSGKSTFKAVKKEGFQCVLLGLPNSGKSLLLSKLTNAKPKISSYSFATIHPEIGTMDYQGVKSQIVDLPPIGSDFFDIGIVNTADCIIIVVEKIQDIEKVCPLLAKAYGKQIIVINKVDTFSTEQLRKLQETIRSKRIPGILISAESGVGVEELKEKIFHNMDSIRVYTKEPGKSPSPKPVVLPINSTIKDVADSIRNGFYKTVKESRVTGPSSKFPNQKVGLDHVLKDKDIVEFKTM